MGYFIGIDIGASFIKGALFDIDKLEISNITKYPSPQPLITAHQPNTLRFEADPNLYEKLIRKLIAIYFKKNKGIEGIVFSTQMLGMVLVNPDITPVTDFIGWQDERLLEKSSSKNRTWTEIMCNKLKGVNISSTGIKLRTGLMGGILFWLKENNILNKNKQAKAMFLGDYIAAKLSKGETFTNATNACGSGVFDVKQNKWNNNILNALGIDISYLPEVVPLKTPIGYMKYFKKQIPVFVSVGDLQATVLGSFIGVHQKDDICINIGTGSQVSFVSPKFRKGNHDIRSYFDNEYLNTITHIPAGRALNVLVKFIGDIGYKIFEINQKKDLWVKINKALKKTKENDGLKADITFFNNNFTGMATGSFANINENNWTFENMFISSFEAMAENYRIAYDRLVENSRNNKIIFSGGLARKLPLLRSLIGNKFKNKSTLALYEEETLTGLFIISLFINKDYKKIKEASLYCEKHHILYKV